MAGKIPIENRLLGQDKKSGGGVAAGVASAKLGGAGKSGFQLDKVADLPVSFDLNNALERAYAKVVHYMNDMLDGKDLEVHMSVEDDISIGHVTDKETGEKISSYDGKEMLRLYAHNNQARGVVVDGKI